MKQKYLFLLFTFLFVSAAQAQIPSTLYVIVEDATSTYEDYYEFFNSGTNMRFVTVYVLPGKQYYFDTEKEGTGTQFGLVDPNIGQSETPPVAPNLDIYTSTNMVGTLLSSGQKFSAPQGEAYEIEIDLTTGVTQINRRIFNAVVYDPNDPAGISSGTLYALDYVSTDEGRYTISNITIPLGYELRFISREGAFLGIPSGNDPTVLTGSIINDSGGNSDPITPAAGEYDITLDLGTGFDGAYVLSDSTLSNTSITDPTFEVFPNPIISDIYVNTDTEGSFKLASVLGQILVTGDVRNGQNRIQVDNLAQGTYFLTVTSNKGIMTKKIIKN
ncbi:hypothetical protein KH5_12120 [Urechidicola sp. KH5]